MQKVVQLEDRRPDFPKPHRRRMARQYSDAQLDAIDGLLHKEYSAIYRP